MASIEALFLFLYWSSCIFFHGCLKIEANKIWKELSALYTLGVQCLETIYQRLKIGDQISSDAELLYR